MAETLSKDAANRAVDGMPELPDGVLVAGYLARIGERTNEHGTFYSAHVEWMGGRAVVELAKNEERKLAVGEPVVLTATVVPYVQKSGGAGYSFRYGTVVG